MQAVLSAWHPTPPSRRHADTARAAPCASFRTLLLQPTMPASLKALLAQLAGVAAAFALARANLLPPGLWPLVGTQAIAAAGTAMLLRSARWWLPIHLGFLPLAVLAHRLSFHPGWYLGAFTLLLLVYWTSFRTQVPLYLTNRPTAQALARLMPAEHTARLLDLGAGGGALLRRLARLRPESRFTGIETAPGPWALGWLLNRRQANVDWRRGDLFALSLRDYDVIYAFLSPAPMAALERKATAEMRPGSLLVSNSFPLPGREADFIVDVGDRRRTRLYCYRATAPENGKNPEITV